MRAYANQAERKIISDVALGNLAPDIVITNGKLFNVFTGEFIDRQSVWIKGNMIAYAGPEQHFLRENKTRIIDADGMVILPGLIDGHTHVLGSRHGIEEFVRHVIPCGVTTVITEAIEFTTIVGRDGLDYVLKGLENQPIRVYCTFPPLCGLTPTEEVNALKGGDILPRLKDPLCLGIGEVYWSNLLLEGKQGERLRELTSAALELGQVVEGHTAGASGRKLQAYTCYGVTSCHEPISEEQVLERLRLGYWVLIREGYIRKELDGIKGLFKRDIDFRRAALCTDGVDPAGFLRDGYLDAALRRAIELGAAPSVAYQMVTLNVAEHFGLDHLIGSVAPGKLADVVMIPSPTEFSPRMVMCDGKILFMDGRRLAEPEKVFFPDHMLKTVNIAEYFFPPLPVKGKVRAMELVSRLVTKEGIVDLDTPDNGRDLNMIFALDRLGSGKCFIGYLKGFGLCEGAYGTTMSWDTPDLIAVGCDYGSLETVIERLKEISGGAVMAVGKEIVAEFAAPLCGVASLKPMEAIRDETQKLDRALNDRGVSWETPILTVDTFGTAAIPHLRINHEGYINIKDRSTLPVEV
jgi:adenine deaminase